MIEKINKIKNFGVFKDFNGSALSEFKTFNLIYGWNYKSHFKAMRFFSKKIPILFRGDSTLLNERAGFRKHVRRIFLNYIYHYADYALYVGKANKDYFLKHGFREDQLFFVPHAVENERFACNDHIKERAADMRRNLNIPLNALVFLFAGKLDENKNVFLLAKVFDKIRSENAYLVIVGCGPLEQALHTEFIDHPKIRFTGFQNQGTMAVFYALCDIFILPSATETWGLSINEAMAAGKAIIAGDACGASFDLIASGVNGFMFKRNNAEELEEYLIYFLKDKDAAARMGKASAEIIKVYDYIHDCLAIESTVNES